MIWYTNSEGKHITVCDLCRTDIPEGENALSIAPGRASAGFFSRDYARQEKVLCPECVRTLSQLLDIMANPLLRTPSVLRLLEAA